METSSLRELGLTEAETKVYLALIQLGDATRGQIVALSKVAGSKLYDLLEKLQDKGLVSMYLQNKVMHFKPTHPEQLLHYLEKKKDSIRKVEGDIKSILPQLLASFNSSKKEQEVELLTGIAGLEILFREQVKLLAKGDTCYVIGGTRGSDEETVQAFFQKIHVMRQEKGIRTRMLFNNAQRALTKSIYTKDRFPETAVRYIGHGSPVAINIYNDRTVIVIFGLKVSAIHIKSQDVANSFMEYFNLLWRTATK